MQTVAAELTQLCFDDLDAPPVVVGSRNWITPAAETEKMFFPQRGMAARCHPREYSSSQGLRSAGPSRNGGMIKRSRLGV